ncbi:alanine racemase [Neoconidiobolus thromboides FSU 785]|nr:alanine racemase [Neoconidiobolus thromboides FSU 785]
MSRQQDIESNLKQVRQTIKDLDQQNKVRLVNVSKTKPISDLQIAYDLGERHFGESYVQELIEKSEKLPKDVQWHFIGSLQSNKCKTLAGIQNLFAIETVSSIKTARALNNHRKELGYGKLNVFLQINTSGEESKSGLSAKLEDILPAVKVITGECDYLNLTGLMTIGSSENSKSGDINPDFELLKKLKENIDKEFKLSLELSMGMSDDYIMAIQQGSTNVRVGSTIFGARNYNK